MIGDCETCDRKQVPCSSCQTSQRAICFVCQGDVADPYGEMPEKIVRAELGVDGSCGFALLGANIQEGEAEFESFSGDIKTSEGARQAKIAINRAYQRLKGRVGRPISYFIGESHPDFC